MRRRQLARLDPGATMRIFDIASDGRRIVSDRLGDNSNTVRIARGDRGIRPRGD